jgi:two-component system, cell cycle response regulator DivK
MAVNKGPFVLVVDDHADTREMLRFGLDLIGIRSEGAESAGEALQAIAENLPDAILLDIGLPDFDGYEVCRRLRQNPATRLTPIIAVTGWAGATDLQRARDAGCNSVLVKPCEFDKVLSELQRHLPLYFPPMA